MTNKITFKIIINAYILYRGKWERTETKKCCTVGILTRFSVFAGDEILNETESSDMMI